MRITQKRILSLLLSAALLFTMLPVTTVAAAVGATFTAVTSDGHTLTYKVLTEDDTLKIGTVQVGDGTNPAISGTGAGNLTIPETVVQNGITYTVTAIGEKAFWSCMGFNGNLTMPDSITSMGKMAFMSCNKFSGELILPSNLTFIGTGAFSGCNGFTGGLVIPIQVTTIGAMAFNGCSGLDGPLNIPNSVTWIEDNAFKNCSNFDSLILGAGETTIGGSAFEGCTGFTGRLIVPGTVKSLTSKAFLGCTNLNDVQFLGDKPGIGVSVFDNCAEGFTLQYSMDTYGWDGYAYNGSSQVTVITVQAPTIIGPTTLSLNEGYSAAATSAYTFTGTEPIMVEKISGDSKITWNDATKKLDIEAGLTAGDYPVSLKVSNGALPDATLDFTLKVNSAAAYTVSYNANGGSVSPSTMLTETNGKLSSLPTPTIIGNFTFDGWFTEASGGTAVTTETVFTANTIIYAHWRDTDSGSSVHYLDDKGIEQTCTNYTTLIADYLSSKNGTLSSGWYVVDSTFTYGNRITISGDVHIILTDSADMTASKGITVEDVNSLTLFGQSGETGKLTATGDFYSAGIGSGYMKAGGTVTINGGVVNATGGNNGAGIGGGYAGAGGTITIRGGTVTAIGTTGGAGIGGGLRGIGGTISIGGGTVMATGGNGLSSIGYGYGSGAGIGSGSGESGSSGGSSPSSGNIAITGNAKVTAIGGMGFGYPNTVKGHGGAGIGSGGAADTGDSTGSVGTITIDTTAMVSATGGLGNGANNGARIGTGGSQSGAGTELSGTPVRYLDDRSVEQTCTNYSTLNDNYLKNNSGTLSSGWYVVDSTFAYGDRITVSGNVHIILTDSADMTASKGITVAGSNSLTIYGQSEGMGKLTATGDSGNSGIGGYKFDTSGTITINGGTVNATGGLHGAGIGSGDTGAGGTITINGGTINATGGLQGAAIGSGCSGACGIIKINGGIVTAVGSAGGTGIGGGCYEEGGTIIISDGMVTATGGQCAAGIGGGNKGAGGTITIKGGTVNAIGSTGGAGIGGGIGGTGGDITIIGGEVEAAGGIGVSDPASAFGGGAGIGSGGSKSDVSGGNSLASGNITITGNANITAKGGAGRGTNTTKAHGGAGIGSGGAADTGDSAGSVGTIIINTTGTVKATGGAGDNNGANPGANIGAGGSQSGTGKPYYTITIDDQPLSSIAVTQGNITGSLSVIASVSPSGAPTHEWFYSKTNSNTGGEPTGVKTASFTVPTDLAVGDHYYYCVVSTMGAASVSSDVAKVTVTAAQPMTHTISASAGANGSISPSGSVSVNNGANQTFTITPNSYYSIRDVKVDGVSVGVVSSYTFSNVTENHSIYAEFYYSYSGSGGGSGSGMTVPKTNITTDKQPNMPTIAKMYVSGTVKDGILSATITEKMVKDAIEAAQGAALKSGKEADGIAVDFNLIGSGSYTNLNTTIDAGTIDRLKESGVKFIKIGSALLDVTLDTGAIIELDHQSTSTITVSAKKLSKLSDAAKKLIGNRPVFDITVSYQKNGKSEYVSNFGKGIVTLGIAYEATGKENKGNLFGIYVDKNGKPQLLTNSSYDNTKRLIFNRNSLSTYGVGYKAPAPTFSDTAKHWAKDNIDFVTSRDLISGTSTTTFAPNTAITRADFLMALGRLSGADVSIFKTSSFTDVKSTDPAMPYIEWAVKNKIVQGIGNGKFGPNDAITREQMAVMMLNYAKATGYKLPVSRQSITFADDAKISAYAKAAVKAIQQTGVVGGKDNNLFDPQGNATRAEASTILRRFVELVIDEGTARGWSQNDVGQWQYIDEKGKPVIGWLTAESNKYHYYFSADGIMVAGKWLEIDGKWYYFNADGSLAKSTKIDGYEVDENGVRKVK